MSKKIIILIIIFVSLIGGLCLYTKEQGKWSWITHGKASKEEVVATYLEGLTQRNAKKISRIVHPLFKADNEIRAKIDELGGNEFKDITVTYKKAYPEFLPARVNAHITGKMITPKGTELPFDEIIETDGFVDGKFYLVIGEARNPVPEDEAILDIDEYMKEHPE